MYDTMTPEELAAQIASAKAALEEMQNAMAPKREELTAQLIEQLRATIDMNGLDAMAIVAAIAPAVKEKKRARKPRDEKTPAKLYVFVRDPSKTYTRGKMPTWMRTAMSEGGYDPELKEDRERFKAEQMSLAA